MLKKENRKKLNIKLLETLSKKSQYIFYNIGFRKYIEIYHLTR